MRWSRDNEIIYLSAHVRSKKKKVITAVARREYSYEALQL